MVGGHELKQPMDSSRSGFRPLKHWRLLLAHDVSTRTCDALASGVHRAIGHVEIVDASSLADARSALEVSRFDACMVCLDLPPAPRGGVRLARELVAFGYPVVLITRSLRWLPVDAVDLHAAPWVTPEADPLAVVRAIAKAVERSPAHAAALASSQEEPLSAEQDAGIRLARGRR
jgi:hypothetical protein